MVGIAFERASDAEADRTSFLGPGGQRHPLGINADPQQVVRPVAWFTPCRAGNASQPRDETQQFLRGSQGRLMHQVHDGCD